MIILEYNSKEGEEFRQVVKSVNFMTPIILGYVSIINGVAEISTGDKFLGVEMYGITVEIDNIKRDDLSKCVNSMQEIEDYINELNAI